MNDSHKKINNDSEENSKKNKLLKISENKFDADKNLKKNSIIDEEISKDKVKKIIEESKEDNNNVKEENQEPEESNNYEEEISKLREEKLRILAEMENLRKRVEREKSESIRFGSANLARDILSPNDNLNRALANIPNDKNLTEPIKNFVNGLQMLKKEFKTILEKHGVKRIDALNKKFDHNFHQAMLEIETDKEEAGVVIQEIQPGYILHDRLLRPTLVGVSKKPQRNKQKK